MLGPAADRRKNMNADYELIVTDLNFKYPNGLTALSGVNFRLSRGEKVAIIGPNGAGKSTLLLALSGLLRKKGLSGTIERGEEREEQAARIGFLFQNPDDQIIGASVEDDVGFILLREGVAPARARLLVAEALEQVRLGGYQSRSPSEMSFGEKKRMSLAGLLVGKPDLIFLDEPALGLDPREIGQLLKILKEMPQTMLLASMDFNLVLELADRVLLLDRGRIVSLGSPADILSDRVLMEKHGLL